MEQQPKRPRRPATALERLRAKDAQLSKDDVVVIDDEKPAAKPAVAAAPQSPQQPQLPPSSQSRPSKEKKKEKECDAAEETMTLQEAINDNRILPAPWASEQEEREWRQKEQRRQQQQAKQSVNNLPPKQSPPLSQAPVPPKQQQTPPPPQAPVPPKQQQTPPPPPKQQQTPPRKPPPPKLHQQVLSFKPPPPKQQQSPPPPPPPPSPKQLQNQTPHERLLQCMFKRRLESLRGKDKLRSRINLVITKMDIDYEAIFDHLTSCLPGPKRRAVILQASDYTSVELWSKIQSICYSRDLQGSKACFVVDAFDKQYEVIRRELQGYANDIQKNMKDPAKVKQLRESLPSLFIVLDSANITYDDKCLGGIRRLITGDELQGQMLTLQANVLNLERTIVESVAPVKTTEEQINNFINQRLAWLREQLAISPTALFAQQQIGLEMRVWLDNAQATASDTKDHRADAYGSQLQTLVRIYNVSKPSLQSLHPFKPPVKTPAVLGTPIGGFILRPPRQKPQQQQQQQQRLHVLQSDTTPRIWNSLDDLQSGVNHFFNTALNLCVFQSARRSYPALDACMFYDFMANIIMQRTTTDQWLLLQEPAYVVSRCIAAANTRDSVHHSRDYEHVSSAYFKSLKEHRFKFVNHELELPKISKNVQGEIIVIPPAKPHERVEFLKPPA